jgi:putative ABC transport system substrate-binding protein
VGALFGAGPEGGRLPGLLAFIEGRYAEGRVERLPPLAAKLVQLKVDVIYASGTPPALAAKAATDTIPIVMIAVGDPVALGLVASLSRPGGNVTGMANLSQELSGKRLDLLREALPGPAPVGVLVNGAVADQSVELRETRLAAQQLGLVLDVRAVRDGPEIERAIRDLAASGV